MIGTIIKTLLWSKRAIQLKASLRSEIAAEGGQIETIGPIGLMLRSPFTGLGRRPVYLQARCTYDTDSGVWFVRETDGAVQWVWKSYTGKDKPPVNRPYQVSVKNDALALPPWMTYIAYALFVAAIVGGPFLYLALT